MMGGIGERQLRSLNLEDVMAAACRKVKDVWAKNSACDPRADTLPPGCGRKMVTYEAMSVGWLSPGKRRGSLLRLATCQLTCRGT